MLPWVKGKPQNIAAEEKKKLSHKYSVDSISEFRFMNHFCPKSTFASFPLWKRRELFSM